jgi:hypothetical protein
MANDQNRDDLDRNPKNVEDEVRGSDEDEFDDTDEGDEEDLEDEDTFDETERITGEVGSEGGSPGDRVKTRRPGEVTRGSEATETTRQKR